MPSDFWGFNPEHLGYTTCIFEGTSGSILHLWIIEKYKKVTEFNKKLCVCDMDYIPPEYLITYEPLVQESRDEYRDLVDSKW